MRYLMGAAFFCTGIFSVNAQNADSLVAQLKTINTTVTNKACNAANAAAISNRAMNIFMAGKTSYLSQSGSLSLYTNYATLNTAEGRVTVNHNFQKAPGIDEPIKGLLSVGADISIPNNFTNAFLDKRYDAGLGVTVSYKFLGKVKTRFADCGATQNSKQKQAMDALRAGILHTLAIEIKRKEADFKLALAAIDGNGIAGQNADSAKAILQNYFYENIKEAAEMQFATLQAEALTNTNNFKIISTYWTSINGYIPIISPKYFVAPSLAASFKSKHPYPLQLQLSHTRLWESSKSGRLFFTLGAELLLNNSKLSYGLNKVAYAEYTHAGGTDTLHAASAFKNDKAYIGSYESFATATLQGRLVYFPPASHIGINITVEQNFGSYNFLNGKIAVPVILINSKKIPAVNVDFYILFTDINNKIMLSNKPFSKASVGLSIGIPFSRLMF